MRNSTTVRGCVTACLGLAALLLGLPVLAQQGPPGGTVADQLSKRYQGYTTYEAKTRFFTMQKQGRWTAEQEAELSVAFDRKGKRLRIDAPDFLLVGDGTKLRIKSPTYPGQHMELDQPASLAYDALVKAAPMLAMMPIPDLVLLTSESPINVLTEGASVTATPVKLTLDPGKPDDIRPGLEAATRLGPMTLMLDTEGNVLERMSIANQQASGDGFELRLDLTGIKTDQPIDDKRFAFDTTGSMLVQQFMPVAPGGGPAQGGGGGGSHPLIGKPAPDFTAKDHHGKDWALADADADVVVLGFWASWAPPIQQYLPAMVKLQEWAGKQEGTTVKIVMINCGEKAEAVAKLWDEQKLAMTSLVDDFTVSDQYAMQVLPHTIIIGEGVVRFVHSGGHDDHAAMLQAQLEPMLKAIAERKAKAAEQAGDEPEPDDTDDTASAPDDDTPDAEPSTKETQP